jgi:malonyl CoA-acyl carrier protein transacylase
MGSEPEEPTEEEYAARAAARTEKMLESACKAARAYWLFRITSERAAVAFTNVDAQIVQQLCEKYDQHIAPIVNDAIRSAADANPLG